MTTPESNVSSIPDAELLRLQKIEGAARNPALFYDFSCKERDDAWKQLREALDGPPGSEQSRLALIEMRMSRLEDFVRKIHG